MKKIISQISLIMLIIMIGMTSVFITDSNAASLAGVAVSAAVEGSNFTVGLILPSNAAGAQCNIKVTYSNGESETKSLVYASGMEGAGFTNSVDFLAKSSGTAKISVTGIVLSDAEGKTIEDGGSKEETLNIQAKPSTTPDNSGTTNSGNSNPSEGTENTTTSNGGTTPPAEDTNKPNENTTTNTSNNTVNTNTTKEPEVVTPEFKEVKETVYAEKSCNVRSSCTTKVSSNKIGGLLVGQSVTRTGYNSEWSRILFNGKTAYVATSLLTTEKPEEKENEVTNEKVAEENTVTNEVENEVENSNNDLAQIQNEIGVLPEVGNNIAEYMFGIISIISLIIVMYMNFKNKNDIEE